MNRDELVEQMAGALIAASEFLNARDEMLRSADMRPVFRSVLTADVDEAVQAWRQWRFGEHTDRSGPTDQEGAEAVARTLYDHFRDRIWGGRIGLNELASASFWREAAGVALGVSSDGE